MAEIHNFVGIKAPSEEVYSALTTIAGLAGWWTKDVGGSCTPGGILRFKFGESMIDCEVKEQWKNRTVRWKCRIGPEQWIGTELIFQLKEEKNEVQVHLAHIKWKKSSDALAYCSTKWATYLLSMKAFIEKGKGRPYPRDIQIAENEPESD